MTKNTIILVGFRSAAIKAALRLNMQVIVWSPKPIPKKYESQVASIIIRQFFSVEFPVEFLTQINQYTIHAVIATTEKSVLPAALLCQQLKLPGNSTIAAELCRDKLLMKMKANEQNIAITDFKLIDKNTSAQELIDELHLPIIFKQRSSSGSRGMYTAYTYNEVEKYLIPGYLAEKFIYGAELSIESYVCDGKVIFTNLTEYYVQRAINIVPAQLADELQGKLTAFNQQIITAMGVTHGITHVEIFINKSDLIFGEIAIRPPGGYLMDLLQLSYGFDAWENLLKLALNDCIIFPDRPKKYSAVWVIHPGPGIVSSIKNLDKIAALNSVIKVHLPIHAGEVLHARKGAGEAYGYILFTGLTRSDLVVDIEKAKQLLEIQFVEDKGEY